jgi:hypothetical protein
MILGKSESNHIYPILSDHIWKQTTHSRLFRLARFPLITLLSPSPAEIHEKMNLVSLCIDYRSKVPMNNDKTQH